MSAYYNEHDPYAAQWLRNLIAAGHIAPGDVDERSIVDVRPDELRGYTQCHFFAGIGVWSYALRRAGWADDRPVWTGSCPCQPFSAAGKGGGFDDERHLWPHLHWLISQCRPGVVLGEQVASKDGLAWLDLVQADLEGTGYASGAVDLCAAGVGSPNTRQRLWWVGKRLADTVRSGTWHDAGEGLGAQATPDCEDGRLSRERLRSGIQGPFGRLADAGLPAAERQRPHRREVLRESEPEGFGVRSDAASRLADPDDDRLQGRAIQAVLGTGRRHEGDAPGRSGASLASARRPGPTNGLWRDADWLFCRDGKWRPVESGTFPLAHGDTARVGRLRAYGNAVSAEAAIVFIESYRDLETIEGDVAVLSSMQKQEAAA